ncbi:MAG TPA: hypothetical protein VFU74_11035 [Actinocrinis sp.]|nr:hypothetical protein [Actinocrinis sp.]
MTLDTSLIGTASDTSQVANEYRARLGMPVSHAPDIDIDIDLDETAPLAPPIFRWANPW